jgi:hypothetical protein
MTMPTRLEGLAGLPPHVPSLVQFSAGGSGTHREGFVVQFGDGAGVWVGNFQRGVTGFDLALVHPDGESVIVVAGGQGYVIDPSSRQLTETFGVDVTGMIQSGAEQLVFSRFTDLEAFGRDGARWRTRRLSWDGLRSVRVEDGDLVGEGWTFAGDQWIAFRVDLDSGTAIGGAYP